MIRGTITRQGKYPDGKDWSEIIILNESKNKLPHKLYKKMPIDLIIGPVTYVAGVHETKDEIVWISSVLYEKKGKKRKARLVDALEAIGLGYKDKIIIDYKTDGKYTLHPER
jgi:hypothetical protein